MGNKNLTLKRILKRHLNNPEDQELHKIIENVEIDKKEFDAIVEIGTKKKPFDKKN